MISRMRRWLDSHQAPPRQAKPWGMDISYSQVRAYMQCPWFYKLRYVDFWRAAPTPPASLGISLHRTLEAFHRSEDPVGFEDLLELYEECWLAEGYPTAVEQMQWHGKGEAILKTYWEAESKNAAEIVAVEREFLFPLGAHRVRGMIDRVDRLADESCEVIDYKTHLDILSPEDAAQELQLRIYGLAAKESLGLKPSRLTLYYVAVGRRVSVPYDSEAEGELRELLERAADIISSGKSFAPDLTACPSCVFRERCAHSTCRSDT